MSAHCLFSEKIVLGLSRDLCFPSPWQFFWEEESIRIKDLLQLLIPGFSPHGHLTMLLWACGSIMCWRGTHGGRSTRQKKHMAGEQMRRRETHGDGDGTQDGRSTQQQENMVEALAHGGATFHFREAGRQEGEGRTEVLTFRSKCW